MESAIIDYYRAIADLHATVVDDLVEHFGEDDTEQVRELRAARQFFAMGRELMELAIARAEQTPPPAPQPRTERTPEPPRESPYFPVWRV
jgi:hypothetical protein